MDAYKGDHSAFSSLSSDEKAQLLSSIRPYFKKAYEKALQKYKADVKLNNAPKNFKIPFTDRDGMVKKYVSIQESTKD
jgi:hypothetical protein